MKVDIQQNCSAWPIDISGELSNRNGDLQWNVSTNMGSGSSSSVWLRLQSHLTLWIDHCTKTGDASATTRLVFAAINRNIGNEYIFVPPSDSEMYQSGCYHGISTLACDVNVELLDSSLCTYTASHCENIALKT